MMVRKILGFEKQNAPMVGMVNRLLFLIDPTWSGMLKVDEFGGVDVVLQRRARCEYA
jgi:hypothetical protein